MIAAKGGAAQLVANHVFPKRRAVPGLLPAEGRGGAMNGPRTPGVSAAKVDRRPIGGPAA